MKQATMVLVTRSGQAGQALTRALAGMGWDARHCPPVKLVGPSDPTACAVQLRAALPVDRIVLTSPEGVRQTHYLLAGEQLASTPIVVPGPQTARLARSLGFAVVVSPAQSGDSESMLALPELANVAGLRILILAAAGGRRLLERELIRRGARVERLHVYRRLRCDLPDHLEPALIAAPALVSMISSGGALEALRDGLTDAAWARVLSAALVVPSQRVAALARELGAQHVFCARGADDQAMIDALNDATSSAQLG